MLLSEAFAQAASLTAQLDIPLEDFLYLLSHICDLSRGELYLKQSASLTPSQQCRWEDYAQRRAAGEPSQYITGSAWFYGLELEVSPDVLIPRPETEGLVELALGKLSPGSTILDIGTGSGAISIALKKYAGSLSVHASDISLPALEIARRNASRHKVQIAFHHVDLFPETEIRYDTIISNPPYISSRDYYALPCHILEHEPQNALLAGADGLDYYRRILKEALPKLNPGAYILFEIGYDQAEAINSIAKNLGIAKMETRKDLAGHDRYLIYKT